MDYFNQLSESELHVYAFQWNYSENLILVFPNLNYLKLTTFLTNDEGSIRSYIDNHCHHKHRAVSVCDVLDDSYIKKSIISVKKIQVGGYFERDEENLNAILSSLIKK